MKQEVKSVPGRTVVYPATTLPNFPLSLSIAQERKLTWLWQSYKEPRAFVGHFYHLNTRRYVRNIESSLKPIWINMVRDPVDRMVSLFYHSRRTKFWKNATAKPSQVRLGKKSLLAHSCHDWSYTFDRHGLRGPFWSASVRKWRSAISRRAPSGSSSFPFSAEMHWNADRSPNSRTCLFSRFEFL